MTFPSHHRLRRLASLVLLGALALPGVGPAAAGPETPGGPSPSPGSADLGLRVVGTVVVNRAGKSVVVVEDRGTGEQGVYHEGDRWGEVRIKKIVPTGVVVEVDGGEEMLTLEDAVAAGDREADSQGPVVARKEVAPELPTARQSAQQVRTRLDHRDGRLHGLIVYNIQPGSALERLGLQDGDVIVGIDGRPVTTTEEIVALYDRMERGGTFALEVERGEAPPQELRFEIR